MSIGERLRKAALVALIPDEHESSRITRTKPRRLQDDDYDSFMQSAEERDDPLWAEIEAFLTGELRGQYPLRASRIQKDIRWMRKRAHKSGLKWGKR